MKPRQIVLQVISASLLAASAAVAIAGQQQKSILDAYTSQASAADPAFAASSTRGEGFFFGKHTGGKPDTPSCTSCHTSNLKGTGKTRAGKEIAPMAPSVNPKRFTDAADVEKWLKRNCTDVLGRECTAKEKSDVLAYLIGQ